MLKNIVFAVIVFLLFLGSSKIHAQTNFSYCDIPNYSLASNPLPTPKPTPKPKPAYKAPAQPISTSAEIESWINQYGDQYGVDKEKLKSIAYCESRFNSGAVNGPYGGIYQYHPGTWSSTRKQMGLDPDPDLRFNAEEAIKTTAYKISVQGTGPWPVCGRG